MKSGMYAQVCASGGNMKSRISAQVGIEHSKNKAKRLLHFRDPGSAGSGFGGGGDRAVVAPCIGGDRYCAEVAAIGAGGGTIGFVMRAGGERGGPTVQCKHT